MHVHTIVYVEKNKTALPPVLFWQKLHKNTKEKKSCKSVAPDRNKVPF